MATAESNHKSRETENSTSEKLAQLRKNFQEQQQKPLKKGDTWFVIDIHWFKQLKKYLGLDLEDGGGSEGDANANPGPIDNAPILDPGSEELDHLRTGLIDELDFALVPEEAWELLVEEFGTTEGQSPIARKVIDTGMYLKHLKVEVYLTLLNLVLNSKPETVIKARFSKVDQLATIESKMRETFQIPAASNVRLWLKHASDTYEVLPKMETTVQDAGLYPDQTILIEEQLPDGSWERRNSRIDDRTSTAVVAYHGPVKTENTNNDATINNTSSAAMNGQSTSGTETSGNISSKKSAGTSVPSAPTPSSSSTISTRYNFNSHSDGGGEKSKPGLCGLSNLGNTCFMNSIIQGLSNTPPIMEYFANDNYIEDINEENVLGMRGEIARAFGELIKSMWSGRYTFVVPRNFKQAVGRFAPQFSGYQQQDSQELLTFLLDGLHEDLNRIKKKPYIELKDSENRPDEEVACEAWENYKARNDSVILDLFHGLLKSTVICPECSKVSVTFDPFCYLSLPLPVRKERQIEVFLVFMEPGRVPTQYKVTVPKGGNMSDLCEALSRLSGVDSKRMVVTDVYSHRLHKIYAPTDLLQQILDRDDIFVYEVSTTDPDDEDTVAVPVYLREKKTTATYSPTNLFGQPIMVNLARKTTTYESLYEIILKQLSRFVTPPQDSSENWFKPEKTNGEIVNGTTSADGENSDDSPSFDAVEPLLEDDATMDEEEDDGKGPPKLFKMNLVNSYGNAELEQLKNDGQPLKISSKNYIALDWHPKAKELFYNEKAAEDFDQDDSFHAKVTQRKQAVRLDECLELYTSIEKLGENDAWYCPRCKKHQQATKKFDLWSLPSVLVISLKRFSYNRYWRDKIDTLVDFPTKNLDMSPYVINNGHGPAVYDLIAVSNHYGGMGGGHYTAYAKNQFDQKWYHFDDSSVSSINEDSVVTKAAYVLFYQRRDLSRMNAPSSTVTSQTCNGNNNGDASSEDEAMDTN